MAFEEVELGPAEVTILILIDGFLQFELPDRELFLGTSHNPYFNRWFSAIWEFDDSVDFAPRHNPYFNRWFSAIYNIQRIHHKCK